MNINSKFDKKPVLFVRLAGIYFLLLVLAVLFMGPFIYGLISSYKDNANEWPPKLSAPQLQYRNWNGAFKMGMQGSGNGFFGEFRPGRKIEMVVFYNYPAGIEIKAPKIIIPEREYRRIRASIEPAAGYITVERVDEIERNSQENGAVTVGYKITFKNPGEKIISILPVDIEVQSRVITYIGGTREPNRTERRDRLKGWDNIASGVVPYVFAQYNRVFSEQYSKTTGQALFLSWGLNSMIYSFVKVITTILFATMAGYALARLKFKGKNSIFVIMLISMMLPGQVTFISNYLVLRDGIFGFTKLFGINTLLNTYTGFVISGLVAASMVFIMKQFFEGLPESFEESARIDGANTYQIFAKIMFPLAKPALGAVSILSFQGAWNDFFGPLVYITSPVEKYPLTVGLKSFQNTYTAGAVDWGPILAGAMISALPVIVLFIFFQRYFIEGVSFSGVKE